MNCPDGWMAGKSLDFGPLENAGRNVASRKPPIGWLFVKPSTIFPILGCHTVDGSEIPFPTTWDGAKTL